MRLARRLGLVTLLLPVLAGCTPKSVAPGRPVRMAGSGPVLGAAVSPDGKRIAFIRYQRLYVGEAASSKVTRIPGITGLVKWPTWANRSNGLAVACTRSGKSDIWLVDLDHRRVRNITKGHPRKYWRAVFSPEDNRLVLHASPIIHIHNHEHEEAFGTDLWLMPSRGGKAENLTNESKTLNRYATWSPDGKRIAFTSGRSGNRDIWVMRLSNRSLRRLTDHPGWDDEPAWSPDGKHMAYVSDRRGKPAERHIWVMNADGTRHRQITFATGLDISPSWAPNSSSLFFVHQVGGTSEVRRIALAP